MGVLTKAMGGSYASVIGQPGVGDLEITCEAGRNRLLGEVIGGGLLGSEAIKKMNDEDITVEGYPAIRFGYELYQKLQDEGKIKKGNMPFLETLYAILYKDEPCYPSIVKLLNTCSGFEYDI